MKQIPVVPIQQESGEFCGPAVTQMLLGFFGHDGRSQRDLAQELQTARRGWTRNEDLADFFRRQGWKVEARSRGTIEDLRRFVERGLPVVVNYTEPVHGVGHLALVVGCSDDRIAVVDPDQGGVVTFSVDEFVKQWRSGFEPTERWLMAIKPRVSEGSRRRQSVPKGDLDAA